MIAWSSATVPAWYELSYKNKSNLVLRIHQKAFAYMQTLKWGNTMPIIAHYLKTFHFEEFAPPSEGKLGFCKVIRRIPSQNSSWITWVCPLSTSNKERTALSASLSVFFQALNLFEGNTDWPNPQLIVVENMTLRVGEPWGAWISATLTPTTAKWLSLKPDGYVLVDVVEAMRAVDRHMYLQKKGESLFSRFEAYCRKPKWVILTVPGNACGLCPDMLNHGKIEEGYLLAPHNTDSTFQQLALLTGLARLHDLVRENKTP